VKVAQYILIGMLRLYRATVSPVLGFLCGGLGLGCRFTPTCSQYALEAVQRYGAFRGSLLAMKRLGKCHPFGSSGHDPVPVKEKTGRVGCPQHTVTGLLQEEAHGS
jgi:putative membrane protein insertion efficiency factor